jgi:hypothetical protein
LRTKIHGAEAQSRYLKAGTTEGGVLHGFVLPVLRPLTCESYD